MGPFRRALAVVFLTQVVWAGKAFGAEPERQELAQKVAHILKTNCYHCHGQDGANEGGFNYVTDLRRLVARQRIVPGNPAKSRVFRRVTDADDPMPPADQKVRPSLEDISQLRKWIEAGAPAPDEAAPRRFLAVADMLKAMHDDLERTGPRARPFVRYFTLTHLHNAGLSPEELQSYRHGLSKLVNSLSWGKDIIVPRAVDPEQTILRIDLRDYQWNDQVWDTIAARNPYGIAYETEAARACAQATRCRLPYVRADWFVAVASRPPLYHEILQLPRSESDLERMLRVDVRQDIRQERVARAGFNGSGVSRNNRLIERHQSGNVVYWRSYDFRANTGKQNVFAHPLGPGDDESEFLHDGGEIIFSLPNGLHAYFLVDGKGQRIDKGPTAIVSDPRRPDRAVENGLSCMSCHARGIIDKNDQVRDHVLKNSEAFSQTAVETILTLYPAAEQMAALMRADARRFQGAVARTGAPLTTTEPIAALAARFESELDLSLAAAEAGVQAPQLLKILEHFPHLAKQVGPLQLQGGTVQRQVFVDVFPELMEALKPGTHAVSRNIYHGKGDVHRLQGNYGQAIAAYSEALRLEPRSALVFNNRGLVFQLQGQCDKALADYDAALRLDPRLAAAYHNRGVTYHARGELDRAIADITEALRLDDRSAVAFNNRGFAYFDKNQYEDAIADFNRALRLDGRFAAALNNRGLAYLRLDKLDQAVGDFTAAVTLNPNLASAYFNRAIAFSRMGDTERASRDRKKAVQLDPTLEKGLD